ncbi:VOC family protein [Paramicrobacterium humi]|uniref:VOC family protein n=1 Tax=Paramicrobacterium humi TaxID=640635 RepID=UPI000B859365|nr:hypothetical protein [Microbacterium humi]
MSDVAKVTSSVVFVTELDRTVEFYSAVFGCEVALNEDSGALLLAREDSSFTSSPRERERRIPPATSERST